jgi:hypothetical protein
MRVDVEGRAVVVLEQLQVAYEVNDQERAEKQARDGHDKLTTNGAGKGFRNPTHKGAKRGSETEV